MTESTSSIKKSSNKWLLAVLAATVLLTLYTALNSENADENEVALSELVAARSMHSQVATEAEATQAINSDAPVQTDGLIPWQVLKREINQTKQADARIKDAFKVHSWEFVAPVKKVKPVPAPPPAAPLVPFTYIGKIEDTPKLSTIFLMANNKIYTVAMGANVNPQWRLDAEDSNSLRLTYLPLNLPKVLPKSAKAIAPVAGVPNVEPMAEINQ